MAKDRDKAVLIAPGLELRTHSDNDRLAIQLRVEVIANGFLVKAGGAPFFAKDIEEVVRAAVACLESFGAEAADGG